MSRLIRLLLRVYPPSLRRDHGVEMAAAVEAKWRDAQRAQARVRFLADLVGDFLASWPREWRRHASVGGRSAGRGRAWAMGGDVRAAWRLFTRAPFFTAGAVITLALGIGATSAVVSLASATLLNPLPIPRADRVWEFDASWSHPDFRDLESATTPFSQLAAWSDQTFGVQRATGDAIEVAGAAVSGGYFALTGTSPLAGRLIGPADDRAGAPAVIVLTERAWVRLFGRDPSVVGSTIQINRRPALVVGIAPAVFRGLSLRDNPDLFVPLRAMTVVGAGLLSNPQVFDNRGASWLELVGRLRDEATPAGATTAAEALYRAVHPPTPGATTTPMTLGPIEARTLGATAGDLERFVMMLIGATVVTLLLACATVANLLLVRSERRRRELAVRAALGAGRGRLIRMLIAESLGIGVAGGVVALAVARVTLTLLGSFQLPGRVSIAALHLTLSPRLFAVSVGLGVVTSVVFGVAPAWRASRVDAQMALRDGARGATRQPIRSALVTVQVALCVLLLAGSIAFGRAMRFAWSAGVGFDIAHTSLSTFNPGRARYTAAQVADVERRVLDAMRGQPWVTGAAWMAMPPLRGSMTWEFGLPAGPTPTAVVESNIVSDGYFDAMAIPVRQGRGFTTADTPTSPDAIVISESMARKFWPKGDALGARVSTDTDSHDPSVMATVVGIVGDISHSMNDAHDGRRVMAYQALAHAPMMRTFPQHLVVRSALPPDVALVQTAAIVKQVDPNLPLSGAQTMADHFGALLLPQRLGLTLFLLFASLAAVLTTLGLYAVVAFAVAQRSREIGVRVALGAERSAVLGLVARQGLTPILAGLALGLGAFGLAATALRSFLFALPVVDVPSLGALAVAVGAIATIAMLAPARRALAVDAATALRNE